MSLGSPVLGHAHVHAAAAHLRERFHRLTGDVAAVGVILGSGLGRVADVVLEKQGAAVEYGDVPHFPVSSVEGHKGRMVFGSVEGKPVLLMQGRVHRYEGYPASSVVFPVRVLHALGVKRLIVTNAAGGLGDGMKAGDLMLIEDHLNLTGDNPLLGANDGRFGARFPDMSDAYTARLRTIALEVAGKHGITMQRGVYAGLLGPSYETPAEIRMLRTFGASAVGMSTVHEVIAASHLGIEVLGISCITNAAAGVFPEPLHHSEVMETAQQVKGQFIALLEGIIGRL